PKQAQVIDKKSFSVLPTVEPATVGNGSAFFFVPPGHTLESLKEKPFHIYDEEFYDIIGPNPTLTVVAESSDSPLFFEGVVWYPPTDEIFIVQEGGTGSGPKKSGVISKISVSEAAAVASSGNGTVTVETVNATGIVNPNGGANYKGQIVYVVIGSGSEDVSQVVLLNPVEPYNTTVLVNNFFGRQFNTIDDVAVNPRNNEVYFSDTGYGYLMGLKPAPGIQNQIYKYNDETGAVAVVADGFDLPNGVAFSPNGSYAYITDTAINVGTKGWDLTKPSTIYRFDVQEDGTFENRKTFAFIDSGVPDGIHCDSKGNVYAATSDGVNVWNQSGNLIGKIFLGKTAVNFNFAGDGRLLIGTGTELYYAGVAASG
ncbi:hypothetical protein M426DRAFT_30020, partial [Hypoxylon sp. CI-4A]